MHSKNCYLVLILPLICFFGVVSAVAEAPQLELGNVTDREVARALERGYNLTIQKNEVADNQSNALIDIERQRLMKIMRAFGYYTSEARFDRDRWKVTVETGARFGIGIFAVRGLVGSSLDNVDLENIASVLPRYVGKPARADTLSKLESEILFRIGGTPHPFARTVGRKTTRDFDTRTVAVELAIEVGKTVRFGDVIVRGLRRLAPHPFIRLAPFARGDLYDRDQMMLYKKLLEDTGQFRSVRVEIRDRPGTDFMPVEVTLVESTIDTKTLAAWGFPGLVVTVCSLLILAGRQVLVAARNKTHTRTLDVVVFRLLALSALFAIPRTLSFLKDSAVFSIN